MGTEYPWFFSHLKLEAELEARALMRSAWYMLSAKVNVSATSEC